MRTIRTESPAASRETDDPSAAPDKTTDVGRASPWWRRRPDVTTLALIATLALALVLRLWGIRHGLPFVYNVDEAKHFVPVAVRALGGNLHPPSFINPPAFAYAISVVSAVWYGGAEDTRRAWEADPAQLYLIGRLLAAGIGTVGVWLLYVAGARFFGRTAGLLGAAAMAVAFLPVFYSHQALNDVPAMTALTLSLVGTAGVLRNGRAVDYALGGAAAGLAAGLKYPAGIALVALITAGVLQALNPVKRRTALGGIALAVASAFVVFVCVNPYALLAFSEMRAGIEYVSRYNSRHFLGLPYDNGYTYYPRTLTWGLGWVPALAALAGAVLVAVRDRRTAIVLLPTAIFFFLVIGSYAPFGRYLLPLFPIVCLLAGYAAASFVAAVSNRWRPVGTAAVLLAIVALTVQGLVYSVHNDLILSRTETRTLAREWMLTHIPPGGRVVLEPVPRGWIPRARGTRLWDVLSVATIYRNVTGSELGRARVLRSNYVSFLRPDFVDYYRTEGVCWIMTSTAISGSVFVEPGRAENAHSYYERLDRDAELAFYASPYGAGAGPVPFSFDFSNDYYPLAYDRPGPEVRVYRIRGGRCA
jgi:hypothetical protein